MPKGMSFLSRIQARASPQPTGRLFSKWDLLESLEGVALVFISHVRSLIEKVLHLVFRRIPRPPVQHSLSNPNTDDHMSAAPTTFEALSQQITRKFLRSVLILDDRAYQQIEDTEVPQKLEEPGLATTVEAELAEHK